MDDEIPPTRSLEERVARLQEEVAALREDVTQIRRALTRRFEQVDRLLDRDAAPSDPDAPPPAGEAWRARPVDPGTARGPTVEGEAAAAGAGEPAEGLPTPPSRRRRRDLEVWVGQNALLTVGLLALVAGAAFLLRHAFEQGWISPGLRVGAGLVTGLAVAAYGERLQRRGMHRYGAATVGGGGAIAYLALWAAAGPYALVGARLGIPGLVMLAGLVLVSAARSGVELLGGLAAVGAYLVPVILPATEASASVLLAYCASVAIAAGAVAVARAWRLTLSVVLAGYFLLPAAVGSTSSEPVAGVVYLLGGGAVALWVTDRADWAWLYRGTFVLAWPLAALHVGSDVPGSPPAAWAALALLPVLALPTFRRTRRLAETGPEGPGRGAPAALAVAALLWTGATLEALPGVLDPVPLLVVAGIAAPFVIVGHRRALALFHAVGFGVLAWGIAEQWDPPAVTAGWVALGALSAVLTRPAARAQARWTGLALLTLAALALFTRDLGARPATETVLTGSWSLAMYAVTAGFALLGGPLWGEAAGREEREAPAVGGSTRLAEGVELRGLLWAGAGATLLLGGTVEIFHHFGPGAAAGEEAGRLARDLAVSAWWLAFAGALVAFGFWRDRRHVRIAGLVVAGVALLKVAAYDLVRLSALYRVASLVLLAALALAAAYAYHRRGDGDSREDPGEAAEPGRGRA